MCVHQCVFYVICAEWCFHVLAKEHREVGKQPSGIISLAYPWDPGLSSDCQSHASPCIQRAISPVPFSDLSTFRFPFHLSCGLFSSVFYCFVTVHNDCSQAYSAQSLNVSQSNFK